MSINALPIGHTLQNDYKIERVLGAGGFGITYLARDINLNYLVVIKEFLPQDMATRDQSRISVTPFTKDTQSYDHLLKRFSEEAQLLAKMRHPNIVKVIRFFKENNTAYFVMEYAEGETLKEYLQRHNTMSEEEILSVMMPILEGAKYVHAQGFLHRDIAPDNIYLLKGGMPILIDFGAARDAIAEESKNISSIVKEGYSSPEQYTVNNKQNASSDIYALGSVFYRMITGKVPANAPHRQTALLNDDTDPIGDLPTQYKNKYSQKLLHAVTKAMNIRAVDRFASVFEFQNALLGDVIIDSTPSSTSRHIASTAQNTTNKSNDKNNNGLVVAFIVVLLLLVAGIGYVYMGQEQVNKSQPAQPKPVVEKTVESSTVVDHSEELEKAKRELAEVKRQKEEAQRQHKAEIERQKQETEALRLKAQEEAKRLKEEQHQKVSENVYELLKLAKAYYYGSSTTTQNYYKAKEYFLRAANLHSIDAYRYLGTIYLFGHGAAIDKKEAKKWLQLAIDAGDSKAQKILNKYFNNTPKNVNYQQYKVINVASNDTLNVRTNPYVMNNNKVGELKPYARGIRVMESKYNHKNTKWSRIEYNERGYILRGWVVSRCLAPTGTAYTKQKMYKVFNIPSNDTLSVRNGPGRQYSKIGDLPYYARNVKILKCQNSNRGGKWCSVTYGTIRGWVSATYLREQ